MKKQILIGILCVLPLSIFAEEKIVAHADIAQGSAEPSDKTKEGGNVTQITAGLGVLDLDKMQMQGGIRALVWQNKGLSDKVHGQGDIFFRFHLLNVNDNARISLTQNVGGSDRGLLWGIALAADLCSSKVSEKKSWTLCFVNNARASILTAGSNDLGGKLELSTGLELQKMIGENVRISGGARYALYFNSNGDEKGVSGRGDQIIAGIGVEWDVAPVHPKRKITQQVSK